MTGLKKLKVAFDRFDEKGPLPNLNDSIVFDNFYKDKIFSKRTEGGCTIPYIIMRLWQQNKLEFINTKEVTKEQKAIYPIQFYCGQSIEQLDYLSTKGFKNFTIYDENFIENIKYILIGIDMEPVNEGHFSQIKSLFYHIPKEKIIFIVNNKLKFEESFNLQVGVNHELDIIRPRIKKRYAAKEKKFCVLNNSENSNYDFRQATLKGLKKKNLLDYADYTHKTCEDINYITDNMPNIFKHILSDTSIKIKEVDKLAEHIENNSYFSLVLEAYYNAAFAGRILVTEKSLRPMMWRKPFILIGQPHTLKALQDIGYETFHPFIDESYDDETDNQKRFIMAMIELEKLCNKSLDELKEFNSRIDHILEYNYNHIDNRIENMENYLLGLTNENY
jgi:hypothetical protein